MQTISLTSDQKEVLCRCLAGIEAGIEALRQEIPELRNYSNEKVMNFLQEVRVLQSVDKALKDEFQPCSNAHETALDAVGAKATLQIKEFAGVSSNTRAIKMRPGKSVADYVTEILHRSGKKKAYFAFRNRYLQQVCVAPVRNFLEYESTCITWNQITSSPRAKIIYEGYS